ncbi:metallophosphoesterase [Bradyrhizobium liaoningense]|uniref:metallophosphoesterase family protein n=1 Tax=Bradyrhizobium liaoningense TaxID=43992 RepID=UPI001BAD99A3|nr:metallophosphoesterase [Bradyrhizobium liaoningense]MBR0716438.1 metallophosphoesterase [Bradyrhizobium liaoningense]
MPEFRLTQISDTHLTRRLTRLTENFARVSDHIATTRPDLVVNTGDLAFDAPTGKTDLEFAKDLHDALPVPCRHLPGNHDIGDNPTEVGEAPKQPVSEEHRQEFCALVGEDRWQFEAAGWCFIGLNSLVMNSGLAADAEQFDWLARELSRAEGKPIALFLHKPLFLNLPGDSETIETAIRYVPQPARRKLIEMIARANVRLVASGHVHQRRDYTFGRLRHVWAPSTSFILSDKRQERIGIKETGLVEYRFRPDSLEVRHVKAAGLVDIDLDDLLKAKPGG